MNPLPIDKEKVQALAIEAERQRKLKDEKQRTETKRTPGVEKPGDITERLLAMASSAVQHRRNYEEWARPQPKTKKCEVHAYLQTPDMQAGAAAAIGKPKEQWQLIFRPCPKCERDSQFTWLKLAGVPSNMTHCTIDNWTPRTNDDRLALETVRQFCRRKAGFLIIRGKDRGIGKTHLAVAIMREWRCGMFRTQAEFFEQYQKRFQPNASDILERAKVTKLFIMDDFGVRAMAKENDVTTLHSLFNHRYGECLPTIITSNDPYEDICRDLGERMQDRLEEAAFAVIELHGKSHRAGNRSKYGLAKGKKPSTV